MSNPEAPASPSSSPSAKSRERQSASRSNRKGWWIAAGIALLLAAVGGMLLLPTVKQAWRLRQARELTAKGDALMKAGQPEEAFRCYADAVRKAPRELSVLRQMAKCLDELPGAESNALRMWNDLHHLGGATWEDTVAMGYAALKSSNLSRAREIEAALPKSIYGQRKVREFRAMLLGKAGNVTEAQQQMRTIWSEYRDDPECRVKLATMDIKSADKALQSAAETSLWEAARGEGKISGMALMALAEAGVLDAAKAAELALLARKSPVLKDDERYYIFDYCVLKSPDLLPTIISMAREMTGLSRSGSRERFYQWVSAQNQPDVILSEIPESEALSSRGLFLARADSLMRKGMWDDLRRMLDGRLPPVSKVDLELMRAFLARSQNQVDTVRSHLNGAILFATGGSKAADLAQVGAGAEVLGHPDIALLAYGELAKLNTPVRLQTYKRIYQLNQDRRDASGMLRAASSLLKLEPALLSYANKLDYLRLITGIELDEAIDDMLHSQNLIPDDRAMAALSKALAASYAGDGELLKANVEATWSLVSSLEPGPKAVLAGLLWQTGREREAAAIASSLADSPILEEERWFLDSIKKN